MSVGFEFFANARKRNVNHVAQLLLREIGDADSAVFNANPFVVFGVM
jgi:hypothetical protein